MYDETKAAQMAAYLLFKAGAEGLSQRQLLALMYLAERAVMTHGGIPISGDQFILTEDGPVMKLTRRRLAELPERSADGADGKPPLKTWWLRGEEREWAYRIEPLAPMGMLNIVAESGLAYAPRPVPATRRGRLALRNISRYRGMPYFGWLSRFDRRFLRTAWSKYGALDEKALLRHMRELPEANGASTGALPLEAILESLGFNQREIEETLELASETDSIRRLKRRISAA